MPIRDDEQFETYLREFKPVAAGSLPAARRRSVPVRFCLYFVPAAAAVAVLLVLMFTLRGRSKPVIAPQAKNSAGIQELATAQPLTLQQANELLAHAPTFSAALDNVAFQRQRRKLPHGSLSALAALGKEDIKL